jgi:hypothetical protein
VTEGITFEFDLNYVSGFAVSCNSDISQAPNGCGTGSGFAKGPKIMQPDHLLGSFAHQFQIQIDLEL